MSIQEVVLAAVGAALVSCETLAPVEPARDGMAADGLVGQVTRVVDGDTFWLDTSGVSIRVWGLDAPERGTPGGAEATAALAQLIAGERLTCRERDIDRYGRIVGQCFLADGSDITAALIASGTSTEYCRYSDGFYGTC